jgi:hypothetical protein
MYTWNERDETNPLQDTVFYSIADDNAWKTKWKENGWKVQNTMERGLLTSLMEQYGYTETWKIPVLMESFIRSEFDQ